MFLGVECGWVDDSVYDVKIGVHNSTSWNCVSSEEI